MSEQIRVVIVDDIAETREHLTKLLSFESDIEVVGAASSGEEAVDLTAKLQPDILLMDINMPGMDGNEVARRIRSSGKGDVPIIGMSGYDVEIDKELFTISIDKPFRLQPFMDVVKSVERSGEIFQGQQAGF